MTEAISVSRERLEKIRALIAVGQPYDAEWELEQLLKPADGALTTEQSPEVAPHDFPLVTSFVEMLESLGAKVVDVTPETRRQATLPATVVGGKRGTVAKICLRCACGGTCYKDSPRNGRCRDYVWDRVTPVVRRRAGREEGL